MVPAKLSDTDVSNNNAMTSYTYDNLGRLTQATQTAGSLSRTTNTSYDDINLGVTSTSTDTGTQQLSSTTYFDALGRVRLLVQGPLSSPISKVQKAYRYGSSVSYELESNPYLSASDPTMGWNVTTRDPAGRVTSTQRFTGSALTNPPPPWGSDQTGTGTVTTAYNQSVTSCNGPATKVTDETGSNTHTYCADGLGRLTGVTEPNGTVTNYSYDFLDNLLAVYSAGQATAACPNNVGRFPCAAFHIL